MKSSQPKQKLPPVPLWKRLSVAGRMLTVERVCIAMIVVLFAYGVVVVPYLIELLGYYRKNGVTFHPSWLLLIIPGFVCSRLLYLLSTKVLVRWLQPYFVEETKGDRQEPAPADEESIRRIGNSIGGAVYYALSVGCLMTIIFKDRLLPVQLFGTQDPDSFCLVWPEQPSLHLQVFYMMTLGHHFERLYYEFAHNRRSATFFMMLYHHVLTIALIGMSFWTFLHKFGVFILVTHDFTDIILNTTRVVRILTRATWITTMLVAVMMVSWFWLRLAVFIRVVLVAMAKCYGHPESSFRRFFVANLLFLPALTTLACLNIFWFIQMLKVTYERIFRNQYQIPYIERKPSEQLKSE